MDKFEQFIRTAKFQKDDRWFYPGVGDPTLLFVLSEKINIVASELASIAQKEPKSVDNYQDAIRTGLQSFSEIYLLLDTVDRERICHYFEELMDLVGLECSGGLLNKFMDGWDIY